MALDSLISYLLFMHVRNPRFPPCPQADDHTDVLRGPRVPRVREDGGLCRSCGWWDFGHIWVFLNSPKTPDRRTYRKDCLGACKIIPLFADRAEEGCSSVYISRNFGET